VTPAPKAAFQQRGQVWNSHLPLLARITAGWAAVLPAEPLPDKISSRFFGSSRIPPPSSRRPVPPSCGNKRWPRLVARWRHTLQDHQDRKREPSLAHGQKALLTMDVWEATPYYLDLPERRPDYNDHTPQTSWSTGGLRAAANLAAA